MKALGVAVLGALLILGMGTVVLAQQTGSPSSATDATSTPSATSKADEPKATMPPGPAAPAPAPAPAPSASVDVRPRGDATGAPGIEGSASPRTERSGRIFGLDPTAAALIGAGILIVVIIALVAMARNDSTASSRVDIDRRL